MAAQSTPTYVHEPLDTNKNQIRLIHIVTEDRAESPISINIETHDQETAPPYIALSYAWEDPDPQYRDVTYPINVGDTSIQVSRTVYQALVELRAKIREASEDSQVVDLPLWLDQICIDQSNFSEKNHQVSGMASIYKNAESVIAWLFGVHLHPHEIEVAKEVWGSVVPSSAEQERVSLVFSVPYWTRLWIVQEIMLARRRYAMWHGGILISWKHMNSLFVNSHAMFRVKGQGLTLRFLLGAWKPLTISLSESITHFSTQRCKDPSDKVYALQGLLAEHERVPIDYRKSVHAVFLDVVQVMHAAWIADTSRSSPQWELKELGMEMGLEKGTRGEGSGFSDFVYVLFHKELRSRSKLPPTLFRSEGPGSRSWSCDVNWQSFLFGYSDEWQPCSGSRWWIEHGGSRFSFHSSPWTATFLNADHDESIRRRRVDRCCSILDW